MLATSLTMEETRNALFSMDIYKSPGYLMDSIQSFSKIKKALWKILFTILSRNASLRLDPLLYVM